MPEVKMTGQRRRLIKLSSVEAKIGQKKGWIYARIKEGTFPRQVIIGPRAVVWVENEIDEWLDARITDRDNRAASNS